MRKRNHEAGMPQRTIQVLGQDNQPVFAPGASSTMQSTGFSDFVVSCLEVEITTLDYDTHAFTVCWEQQ
jgi:hypothetical protein